MTANEIFLKLFRFIRSDEHVRHPAKARRHAVDCGAERILTLDRFTRAHDIVARGVRYFNRNLVQRDIFDRLERQVSAVNREQHGELPFYLAAPDPVQLRSGEVDRRAGLGTIRSSA